MLNIADAKSVLIEHPRTSQNLSKAIRQAEKVSQVSSAGTNSDSTYIMKQKKLKILWLKKM